MYRADLHIHTTASDGVFTPSQVVLRAKERGVNMLAISDHDAVSGLHEGVKAGEEYGVRVIPGLEISAGGDKEIHILGYGVPCDNAALNTFLRDMKQDRIDRSIKMVKRLCDIGLPLSMNDIPVEKDAVIGRPRIARAMIAKGYIKDVNEAFEHYIGNGCPAYVERTPIDVCDAVCLLRSVGAVPVLAHAGLLKMDDDTFAQNLKRWMDAGLMGMEVYHPSHLPDQLEKWAQIAAENRLLVTGGSDFHDPGDKHGEIGQMLAYWQHADEDMERLIAAMEETKG